MVDKKRIRKAVKRFTDALPAGTSVSVTAGGVTTPLGTGKSGKKSEQPILEKTPPPPKDTQRITVIAQKLLDGLRAILPLASKDKEQPHLTQVRMVCDREKLALAATDGHAMGKVFVPTEDSPAGELVFCVQTSFANMLVRALSRVNGEARKTLEVVLSVGRFRVVAQVGEMSVTLPNAAEQLQFPIVENTIPDRAPHTTTAVTTYAIAPKLLARVMRAAGLLSSCVTWRSPKDALAAVRFDLVDDAGELTAIFIVLPMRGMPSNDDDDDFEAQTSFEGAVTG